jgi:hypothetical protein
VLGIVLFSAQLLSVYVRQHSFSGTANIGIILSGTPIEAAADRCGQLDSANQTQSMA